MTAPNADKPRQLRSLPRFISANNSDKGLIAQTVIHTTFLLSAKAIAYTDKLMVREGGNH